MAFMLPRNNCLVNSRVGIGPNLLKTGKIGLDEHTVAAY
jgi:hypothetical protein